MNIKAHASADVAKLGIFNAIANISKNVYTRVDTHRIYTDPDYVAFNQHKIHSD